MAREVSPVHEARALLLQFTRSNLKAAHVATDWLEFFVSRDPVYSARARIAGRQIGSEHISVSSGTPITAPHLGTITSLVEENRKISKGDVIAELCVLDRTTEVTADRDGAIARRIAKEGALAEYGQPLVEIA